MRHQWKIVSTPVSFTSDSEILRYYAPSRDDSKIPEVLKPISSLRKSTRSLEEVKAYRVVVMTLVTSGRLSLAGLGQGHFTHVFVDEAGHAIEPEALVAISGILGKLSIFLQIHHNPASKIFETIRRQLLFDHFLYFQISVSKCKFRK